MLSSEEIMLLPKGIRVRLKDSSKADAVFKAGGILIFQAPNKVRGKDRQYGIWVNSSVFTFAYRAYDYIITEGSPEEIYSIEVKGRKATVTRHLEGQRLHYIVTWEDGTIDKLSSDSKSWYADTPLKLSEILNISNAILTAWGQKEIWDETT